MAASDSSTPMWRMWAIVAGMLLGIGILSISLWTTQILRGSDYVAFLNRQSFLRVRLPGARGKIVDRNGVPLVENRPSYNIAIFMDDLGVKNRRKELIPKVRAEVEVLKEKMNLDIKVKESAVKIHYDRRRPLPLTLWQDLSPATLATFSERGPWDQGLKLIVEPVRQYTFGSLSAHILGHVGKPESSDEQEDIKDYNYYQVDLIGKSGIEKDYDQYLRGVPGTIAQQLDAWRNKIAEFVSKPAKAGNNVVLTIDNEIQRIAEEAFQSFPGYKGAVVIADPRNGDILALVSWPSFDPNWFVPSITRDRWVALQTDPNKPLLNRAIQSIYSPGSTFKVPVALAALESGTITPETTFHCPGYYSYGNRSYACWEESGHGVMNVRNAIRMSCNVFFYNVGARMGPQTLGDWMIRFGYGQKTGVNLENENPGLVPTDAWQSRVTKGIQKKMAPGEGVNMAIGQGALNITVIQMAMLYAAVANDGILYKPRLVSRVEDVNGQVVKEFPPEERLRLPVQKQWIDLVKLGMIDVVQSGTGRRAAVEGFQVAGKTGSAQFKGVDRNTGAVVSRTRTWFDSVAPAESPRYAMAIIVEGGVSGGTTAAPIAAKIYEEIHKLEKRRAAGKAPTVVPGEVVPVPPGEMPGEIGGGYVIEAEELSPEELERLEQMPEESEEEE